MASPQDEGWIKLFRKIKKTTVWQIKPYSPGQAFIDMLLMAERTDNGTCKRGEFCKSQRELSLRWGWTRQKVRHFVKNCAKRGEIRIKSQTPQRTPHQTPHISIVNFNSYQTSQPSQQPREHPTTYKEEKNNTYAQKFAQFWTAYPKKKGKKVAQKAFEKVKPSEELLKVMIEAIERDMETDQWKKQKGQFIPFPATWLNQARWEDEVEQQSGPRFR